MAKATKVAVKSQLRLLFGSVQSSHYFLLGWVETGASAATASPTPR